ncbi:unnamed protein product [Caenorhabditis auriculariae]|uniref:RNase NYN domain-containing protein n=1 Tax=Caenorhabditis auriculariae TaxID=2777116 RepID=A0A8S1HU18_9PELO|nr:unnamed protein product [Caenorhabditis auriculariae]
MPRSTDGRTRSDGLESSLSVVGNEATLSCKQRQGVTLLRPVFMNAVEVGYSYAQCDRDKKLNVRGVTIALWYFICKGHQAIALLPYCFKSYAEKSSCYAELMALYRLNLIEFTPGYGSEKYAEVNRIMVNRAHETGGCIVARSQMQGITENKPNLINVVEQRLLMPTFNGDDIMFPIDGPLGRNGPSLKKTLECEQGDQDWRVCSEHQLLFSDQRHWLEKIAQLAPEKTIWNRMSSTLHQQPSVGQTRFEQRERGDRADSPFNRFTRRRQSSSRSGSRTGIANGDGSPVYREKVGNGGATKNENSTRSGGRRKQNLTSFTIGTLPPPMEDPFARRAATRNRSKENTVKSTSGSTNSSGCSHGCACVHQTNSYDEEASSHLQAQLAFDEECKRQMIEQRKSDELLARTSQIFGYKKASRVFFRNPSVRNLNQLVEKCLQEEDFTDDDAEFVAPEPRPLLHDVVDAEAFQLHADSTFQLLQMNTPNDDLIDFTDEEPRQTSPQRFEPPVKPRLDLLDLLD